jgi:hypothetical protein
MPSSDTKRPRPKITISKETTYITEPLRADGCVDYVAAVNRHCSEGVKLENNAAIPFWQAVGPKELDKKIRKQYFELLGIPELPEEGPYLVSFSDVLQLDRDWNQPFADASEEKAWSERAQEQENACSGPWAREEHPLVASMLERNEGQLRTLVEGVWRPRFYSPVVSSDIGSPFDLTTMMELREAGQQLRARAMLQIREGRIAQAWKDILACHRLARLFGQAPFVLAGLTVAGLEAGACSATKVFAQQGNLTAEQARQSLDDLRRLPERQSFRARWEYGDRITCLATAIRMATGQYRSPKVEHKNAPMAEVFAEERARFEAMDNAEKRLSSAPEMDWDEALRHCNVWYDRTVAAHGEPTYAERCAASAALLDDLGPLSDQAMEHASAMDSPRVEVISSGVSQLFAALRVHSDAEMSYATMRSEAQAQTFFNLACLALALAGYRHDNGHFPKTLAELRLRYIAQIPKDPFSDGNLHYTLEGDGYLLYSVGPNGTDDGGRNFMRDNAKWYEDESATEEEQSWDDIAIRMPPKKAEK